MTEESPQETPRVAVIADTTTSIPEDIVKSLQIDLVPYYVIINKQVKRDVYDVERREFYSWLTTATEMPTTSNPGAGDYLTAFRNAYKTTKEMIAIAMTSTGSGAYQAAMIAKEMAGNEMPDAKIMVVDTRQTAMAHGWAVIMAARAAQAGASLLRVGAVARETAFDAMMLMTADTLRYLYMGGRIGRALHLVGSILHVKPLISMEDGVIVSVGQARSRSRAYDRMVELVAQKIGAGSRIRVAYMHAAALQEVEELRQRVEAAFECVESLVVELSPALGVHTGPGTAGLVYVPVR